ncbi:TetR/AcrR family transcriptional regulator [Hyphococcus flavus]|uniref:TetR/AcrR family transcriptional regulator n=1 Tax=Hyphococcus flavus TaxID=1866326 RepID=A0AAE9ZDN6_9PROT|nr:TetR/AcrR family transcriptional regulator [Hyphococcus flavus]WDI31700.1 TetR/AcrR family transcriptional regulator [Hyphococcus flavus]
MRRRICEGAVSCLSTRGYHGTSIKQVVNAAGVSLGALQHHFPAKDDLVEATAEFLLSRSVKWFQRAKHNIDQDKNAFGDMIRRSWREQFTTDEYGALLEILVAARTNATLRHRIAPKLDSWRRDIEAELRDLLPVNDNNAEALEAILTIGRCMMTGLLVHDGLIGDTKHMRKVIDAWIDLASSAS